MIRNRATLKNLFQQYATPSGTDFADFIDSYLHLGDDGANKIKELLAANKLNASHVDVNAIWNAFVNNIGAGVNFGDIGYTSAEQLQVTTGTELEFEAYLSSLVAAHKFLWAIFKDDLFIVSKSGSNLYHTFNEEGTYTITVVAKKADNSTISALVITDWIIVSGAPIEISQAQIEIPTIEDTDNIIDCEIDGTNITCTVPAGTNLERLIPRIIHGGTMSSDGSAFNNGVVIDMRDPISITITVGETTNNYTLTVSEAV